MNTADPIRIALIGCGRIARWFHLNILCQHPLIHLVAVADGHKEALKHAKKQAPNVLVCENYQDVLENNGIDAVVICLPTHLHASVAKAAFEAGKHVYVEKPLAINETEAREVLEAWQSSGLVGMVGFNNRFHPAILQTKKLLQQQKIGKIVCLRSVQSSASQSLPAWKHKRTTGGGVLLDMASHQLDLISFLFETSPTAVHASSWSQQYEQDSAILHVQTGKCPAQIFISNYSIQENRFEIIGEQGKIVTNRFESTVKIVPRERSYSRSAKIAEVIKGFSELSRLIRNVVLTPADPSYQLALEAFFKTIQGSESKLPTIKDGYNSIMGVLAAEKSIHSGNWVQLQD